MHILLDLDNVLLKTYEIKPDGKPFFYWSQDIKKDLGIDPDCLKCIFDSSILLKNEEQAKQTTQQLLKEHAPHVDYDDFINYWRPRDAILNEAMWQWVKDMSKDHTFHIASNQPVIRMKFLLESYPEWLDVFNKVFYPYPLGAYKPQKEFFIKALEELGADAKDVLFIDDDSKNIASAKELGLQTILFKNIDDVKHL